MKVELFIAKRLSAHGGDSSKIMVRVAIFSIAVSAVVIILALGIVSGFQNIVSDKIRGLASDLQVTLRSDINPYQTPPFDDDSTLRETISESEGVAHIQPWLASTAIMQTKEGIEGVVLKGVDGDYDWGFIQSNLLQGEIPDYTDTIKSREVVISSSLAQKMDISTGDIINLLSVGDNPRRDRFRVGAIYQTAVEEIDHALVMADIRTVRHTAGADSLTISGYEIQTSDPAHAEEIAYNIIDENFPSRINVDTVRDRYPALFDWLDMLDLNTVIVIVIMLVVAGVNMISGLLIIILEQTRTIGTLMTQGMSPRSIQKIFLYRSLYITLIGLLWGNAIGLALALLQQHFGIVTLDEALYMVDAVPVAVVWSQILLFNLGSIAAMTLLMTLPTMIITRMKPEIAVRFQ